MFRRLSSFRRKTRNEGHQSRFHRALPDSQTPNTSPSRISDPIHEDEVNSTADPHLSSSAAISNDVQFRKNSEVEAGPLGLTVVYTPPDTRKADIVFIHGLGGTSRWTWSKNKDPELFWPLKFLPLEPDIGLARILTFGYNANFRRAGNVSTSVLDFAKDLLFDMKYAKDDQKEDLNLGSVPLIFVAHSMGGLIVKEAYMQGQIDPEYESIIKAVSAIIFLSTPHRGTNLAVTLNRILQSTMIISSKQYISELAKNSLTLQKLNEQFRHIAPRLNIVSFYETRPTSIMLKNIGVMILDKDSSVLGYPGEISKALDADHHGVCKYESPRDPNYISVRNVLISLLRNTSSKTNLCKPTLSNRKEPHRLKSLLAITESPAIDYSFFRDQWARGTCEWVLQDESFVEWLHTPDTMSSLLWLAGKAATGKSVLSSFIINNLVERGFRCQYFFIRFGDQKKQSLSLLLRSIAYQVAQTIPSFLEELLGLIDEAIDCETVSARTIWERIFKSILFSMEDGKPLYWIIDGLDEAHDPRATMRLLSDISYSSIPLRILLVSRESSDIGSAFQKVPSSLNPRMIRIEGHLEDLQCYVRQELSMPGSSEFKEDIVRRVVEGSRNNFLWVRLVVDKLNLCHRLSDVEVLLQELPIGMEALYDRMASSIVQNRSPMDKELALRILQCVTCSLRELAVIELSEALDEDMSDFLDLGRSIVDLCGGFMVIDNDGNVTMIHHTAREYLLTGNNHPFHIDPSDAHERMFLSCIKCLTTIGLRAKVNRNQKPEFVDYASSWWSSHLVLTSPDRAEISEVLEKFLSNHWVLTWIHILAANNQQRILIQTSKNLSAYCLERQRHDAASNKNGGHSMIDLLESWSTDFVKLVGKFGTILRRNPESIYKFIPPFCPQNSSIYRLFGKAEAKDIVVSGIPTENWDDLLARLSLRRYSAKSSVKAFGSLICLLVNPGNVLIYDPSTFEEAKSSPIIHGEWVQRMELNSTTTILATYGYRKTKIWEISTGNCRISVDNVGSGIQCLSILSTMKGNTLLIGNEDGRIWSLDLDQQSPAWQLMAKLEEPGLEGCSPNSSYMTLNGDGTLAAIAYKGLPLSAWELAGPVHIGHCRRAREDVAPGEVIDAVWHPHSPEVLGLFIEGTLFKWHPYEGETVEITTRASKLAISRDGNLLAAAGARGMVNVYATSDLALLYQFISQDMLHDLTFSPDGRRLYDIGSTYANVWEPDVLMKFAEKAGGSVESGSETASFPQSFSKYSNSLQKIDTVTVLATSPAGRLYSYGTETGTVYLVDTHKGKLVDMYKPKGSLSIEKMSWSNDGRYVSFADTGKRIFIMSVTLEPSTSETTVKTTAEISMSHLTNGRITHLIFQPDLENLLVIALGTIHAISLTTLSVTNRTEFHIAHREWIIHPQDPKLIIGFGPGRIIVLDLNLKQRQDYTLDLGDLPGPILVCKMLASQDNKHLLVEVLSSEKWKEKIFYLMETSKLAISLKDVPGVKQKYEAAELTAIILPRDVSSEVYLPLSLNSHDRLIFLSTSLSVCSWQVPFGSNVSTILPMSNPHRNVSPLNRHKSNAASERQIKELFSLPGDWINRDHLSLCAIWEAENSFLCPKNGEVAVVRCSALY